MAYTASGLVKIADAEIGYHEKATNANLDNKTANSGGNNYQKYGRDLYKAGYYNGNKNGYDWCDQLVDWCFYQLTGKNKTKAEYIECQTGKLGAGCGYSMQYYKDAGRFDKNPKVGDQIFFKYNKKDNSKADHTGIVVEVTSKQIKTIEGNSGNQVKKHTYNRNYECILGYGHPRFDAEPQKATTKSVTKTCTIAMPIIREGDSGNTVRTLQRLLRQLEYVGSDGKLLSVDGKFGPSTKAAVVRWQKKHLGAADGIFGVKSWTKLLRG